MNTNRLAKIAILSAISFILMLFPQFPIIPGVDFLKVEFSILPILFGVFNLDLKAGYIILLIRSLLKLLLNNEGVSTWIGLPMNMVAVAVFITVIYLVTKGSLIKSKLISGSFLATISMTISMLIMNYFYALPLYKKFAGFDIEKMIGTKTYLLSMVLPFNLIEGLIYSLAFFILIYLSHHISKTSKTA